MIYNIFILLCFINYLKQFIKNFSKIAILFLLILKKIALLALAKPNCTKVYKNEMDTDNNNNINDNKINNKIANLLNNIKKIIFKASFLFFKASLIFI